MKGFSFWGMNKVLKLPAGLDCSFGLSEKFIAVDEDSDDENEMNNAAPVPTSSEMRNIMKYGLRIGHLYETALRSNGLFASMFDGLVTFAVNRWRSRRSGSGFLPFRTKVWFISRYHTAAYFHASVLVNKVNERYHIRGEHFGLAIHQNDYQARRRFVEWAQNEIAVVPDFHKRILFSDEAHFWLNGYVNKQNCRIWSEANPQVYVETPLHPEKLTVWCALWAGGILLQKR
ncbi:hypothetical protein TNCV_122351 [Trichonephila clavipes]|nr:hypothetical protein TNCV_122351 [Trichonephila clavipes]